MKDAEILAVILHFELPIRLSSKISMMRVEHDLSLRSTLTQAEDYVSRHTAARIHVGRLVWKSKMRCRHFLVDRSSGSDHGELCHEHAYSI